MKKRHPNFPALAIGKNLDKSCTMPANPRRRSALISAAAIAAGGFGAAPFSLLANEKELLAHRAVRILVPQTPGTTPDSLARTLAPHFYKALDVNFIVENRTGASGMIGMDAVAKASADGHTLLSNVSTTLTLPYFYKNLPFDVLADFEPLGLIGSGNFALVVNQALPVKNIDELVAYVKARPQKLNYASPGLGTHHHLCMLLLMSMTGMELTHVPYKGSAGATTDVLSGQVQVMFLPAQVAMAHVKSGRIRILGGTRIERHPSYPDIPTLDEEGVKGYDVDPWYALWGPKGMAPDMISLYNELLQKTLSLDAVKKELASQGVFARPGTPAELLALANKEHAMWARLLTSVKMEAP